MGKALTASLLYVDYRALILPVACVRVRDEAPVGTLALTGIHQNSQFVGTFACLT